MELESLKNDTANIFNNIQRVDERINLLENKHSILENNQMKLYDFNQIMTKRLATLVEKDQYFEKLLVFVLKLVSPNININYDMKFADSIKTDNKNNNGGLFEVNPYNKSNDFINKLVKEILSPINYHHLKNTTVESLAEGLKSDKQNFHKNLNNYNNFKDNKNSFSEKIEIKQEEDQPFVNNNLGIINPNYSNKTLLSKKNTDLEKFDEKSNSAIKITNFGDDDLNKNVSIMPYENINLIQKVKPSKKTNLCFKENKFEENLNQRNDLKIDDGTITFKPLSSQTNELANITSSNFLDVLSNLLMNRNSLPFGDDNKLTFDKATKDLSLLNKKRKISELSLDERSIGSNYQCEIKKENS